MSIYDEYIPDVATKCDCFKCLVEDAKTQIQKKLSFAIKNGMVDIVMILHVHKNYYTHVFTNIEFLVSSREAYLYEDDTLMIPIDVQTLRYNKNCILNTALAELGFTRESFQFKIIK